MDKPLLSICIPTYNRYKYLKNCLNSIICQKEFQEKKVEIVISDNASTDDTQKLCKEYSSHFENIHYYRNPENVHDRNFPLALSRGKGIYRKLSNDTFMYLPQSLCFLCNLILQYNGTEKILFFPNANAGKRSKDKIIKCKSFSQFVCTASTQTTWTGAFGLWETQCERITNDLSGCDLKLWQCKRIYEMVEEKGEALVINWNLLLIQNVVGRDLTYGMFQVLYLNFLSILKPYAERGLISRETYKTVRLEKLFGYIRSLVFIEHNYFQLNLSKTDNLGELVLKEIQEAGCIQDFMKQYKKYKLFYPIKLRMKNVCINVYRTYLSHRAQHVMKNVSKTGV